MILKLILVTFLFSFSSLAEEAPEPEYPQPRRSINQAPEAEYPYPSQKDNDSTSDSTFEKPTNINRHGAYYYGTKTKKEAQTKIDGVEAPTSIGEDGTYYYGGSKKVKKYGPGGSIEEPASIDDEGGYYYKVHKKPESPVKGSVIPQRIKTDGTYIYNAQTRPSESIFSFRGGVYGPPQIKGGTRTYSDVYNDKAGLVLSFDYEWKLFDFLGDLLFKVGSGFSFNEGKGQFANGNVGIEPKEKYQFFLFPNTASLSYKLNFLSNQVLVPYVDGGYGYYTFMEMRSDGKNTRFGGAQVLTASAGLLISLSYLVDGTHMFQDYGVTETWFDLQYRQIIGLDERKDFSSNMITGGFAVGF